MLAVINTIVISIIQVICCSFVVTELIDKKINFRDTKNIIILFLMTICITLFCIYSQNVYKPILIYTSLVIGYKYILNLDFKESIISNFISMILNALSEALVVLVIVILGIPAEVINKYFELTPISSMLVLFLVVLIIKTLKPFLIKIKSILEKEKITYVFYGFIVIGMSILLSRNINNWKWNKEFFVNVTTIFVFIIIILILCREKIKFYRIDNEYREDLKRIDNEYKDSIKEAKRVASLIEKYLKYNHENKNQLIVIKEKAENNEDVVDYVNVLLKEDVGHKDRWIGQMYSVPDATIRGFISIKINKMIDDKLKVIVNISPKVKKIDLKKLKANEYSGLTKMLGVYLDNAYEASKESIEKEVTIEMYIEENKLVIIISNSFKSCEVEKVGTKGYTTKGEGHGAGLSLVSDIVHKYKKIFSIKKETKENYYYQYLYIDL